MKKASKSEMKIKPKEGKVQKSKKTSKTANAKITGNSNLAETIQNNPKSIEVFLKNGLHCIGCAAAHFETISEGASAHGLNDEQIERMIDELNSLQKAKLKESKKRKQPAKKDVHEENFKAWRT